ncbi:uncharacterized protein LOC121861257 [Homarus americanus]|uniref:Uncharacterized protein n=1 Tax=Homarus americanus TaxID=6706 RepID=A0A8J5N465_HOMAM|nr:uncharacterized protein LOC121861257 [Homarus americanus]KAG7172902.1 hypothetical protein Hamer_G017881 [Homarus americanus]
MWWCVVTCGAPRPSTSMTLCLVLLLIPFLRPLPLEVLSSPELVSDCVERAETSLNMASRDILKSSEIIFGVEPANSSFICKVELKPEKDSPLSSSLTVDIIHNNSDVVSVTESEVTKNYSLCWPSQSAFSRLDYFIRLMDGRQMKVGINSFSDNPCTIMLRKEITRDFRATITSEQNVTFYEVPCKNVEVSTPTPTQNYLSLKHLYSGLVGFVILLLFLVFCWYIRRLIHPHPPTGPPTQADNSTSPSGPNQSTTHDLMDSLGSNPLSNFSSYDSVPQEQTAREPLDKESVKNWSQMSRMGEGPVSEPPPPYTREVHWETPSLRHHNNNDDETTYERATFWWGT